jgi:hypothetical protein
VTNHGIPPQPPSPDVARHYKLTLRNYISLTFFALFTLTTSCGQGKEDKSSALFKIKKVYQQINHYKNYNTVSIDDAEEFLGHCTDNGGSLTGYYKGDSLKKVIEWVGLSNKIIQNGYYFDNDKLIFIFSTESRYRFNDSTQSFDYTKLDTVFKGRYYFDNGKLIDTILNDKEHIATKKQDAAEFLTSSKNYLKLLKTKRK